MLELINTIHSFDVNNNPETIRSSPERKKLQMLEYVTEVRIILNEMILSRAEEIKIFTDAFREILKAHKSGKNGVVMWPLSPFPPQELTGILTSPNDQTFQDKSYIMKKLYYNDLLFFYYNFWYKMKVKYHKKVETCKSFIEKIRQNLTEICAVTKFDRDELELESLFKQISKPFCLSNFLKELENIICEALEVNALEIYNLLGFEAELNSNGINFTQSKIYNFIQHYMKNYNASMSKEDKFCLKFQYDAFIPYNYSFNDFEKTFLNCLTLDIVSEYKKSLHMLRKDERFVTYKHFEQLINKCSACKNDCKDMLRNSQCVEHRYILRSIRNEYFKFMDKFTFTNCILSGEIIYKQLLALFNT